MILHYERQSCICKYKAMHECARTRTTDDVTTENTEQKKRMSVCYLCSLRGKQSTTAFVLQSLEVSIGIKGIQIRLQQLKAEGVLLLK